MNKILFILSIVFLFTAQKNFAQQEIPNYTQSNDTCVPASIDDYNRLIKYFTNEKQDINRVLKFDLLQYALMRPNIVYERRIAKNTTIEFQTLFGTYTTTFNNRLYTSTDYSDLFLLANTIDVKHYYNTNNRIKKGKITNGFSANYFSFGIGAYAFLYNDNRFIINDNGSLTPTDYYWRNRYDEHLDYHVSKKEESGNKIVWRNKRYTPNESIAFVRVGYGIQRRIGNIGYVGTDLNIGVGTNKDFSRIYLMPEFSIKAGLAISFSKKKTPQKN